MGHRFVCVDCGAEARPASRLRRSTLPAALAAMTAVAAVLMVIVVARQSPSVAMVASPGATASLPTSVLQPDKDSYLCLREEVLRHGVEWLDRRPSMAATPKLVPDRPLSNREFLDRLLAEQRGL